MSERGEFSYSLKLSAPPGVGGMVPELSLNYSSKDGEGPLGIGWSLGGLSSVSRCPRTVAGHGDADPVDFDGNDRYCLDGSELIGVFGGYGGPGAEYRTASDSIMRIYSHEMSGDGPLWFATEGKNSLIYEFGRTGGARRFAPNQNSVLQWMVNKVTDRNGNYYTIQYDGDPASGQIWPLAVSYTMNDASGGAAGNGSIQFEWAGKPNPAQHSFVGGSRFLATRSLRKIVYYINGQIAREYRLDYTTQESPEELRLSTITECGGGGECLPPTIFSWSPSPSGYAYSPTAACGDLTATQGFGSGSDQPLEAGDWNGDGRKDLARLTMSGVAICLSDGAGFVPRRPSGPSLNAIRGCASDTCFTFSGDWNGDGRLDFAHTGNGESINFYTMNQDAWSYAFYAQVSGGGAGLPGLTSRLTNPILVGDWNGDGRTDFARVGRTAVHRYISTPGGMQPIGGVNDFGSNSYTNETQFPLFLGDFNGDGLTDFGRVLDGSFYRFYLSRSDGSASHYQDVTPPAHLYIPRDGNTSPVLIGDYNGDGQHDFARVSEQGTIFFESTGYGFAPPRVLNLFGIQSAVYRNNNDHPIRVGDWNRDGISDLARVSNTQVDFFVSKGDWLVWHASIADLAPAQGFNTNANYPIVFGDWNADGFTDIARADSQQVRVYQHYFHEARALVAITDGFGRRSDIQYSYLHDPNVYEPGNGSVYPWIDAKSGVRVVASLSTTNGLGGFARTRYKYFGARSGSASGQGGSGFSRIEITNEVDGSTSTTWYQQDAPYMGMPIREERRVSTGALVGRRVNTWASVTRPAGISLPYISQAVEESWDLDGTLIDQKTTSWTLDEFGSPTQVAVSHVDGYTETTVSEYRNDVSSWMLGQLLRVRVTKQAPGFPASTRTVAFEYSPGTNLLVREIIEPDLSALRVDKTYTHDLYGNITSTTVTAAGVEPKTESVQFEASGRFPVRLTNAMGHVTEQTFDARHGLVASVTDPNGVMVQSVYDAFGRKIRAIEPDGIETRVLYLRYNGSGPAETTYFVRTDRNGSAPSFTYHDRLGRVLREERAGFDGRAVYVDRVFNARGLQDRISDPYFAGESPVWTVSEYDLLGRPVWTTLPGNRLSHTQYQGRTTALTDPLGKVSRRTVNTLGQTISSTDPIGGVVTFTYDSAGNQVRMRDPVGHLTETTYDLRGNVTSIRDVDTGLTEFVVDGFGRRTLERRSDGSEIAAVYDKLDRMVSRTTPTGVDSWEYDTAVNGIGKIARSQSGNVVDRTFYDALGRPSRSERSVASTALAMTTSYDHLGRLASVTYPSGFTIRRLYNDRGYLSAIVRSPDQSLVWRVDEVTASGKVITETAGNGMVTRRSYDVATEFLNRIQADTRFNMAFSFDAVGNLTARTDDLLGLREEFAFDNLYRLTESRVVGSTPVAVTYDAIGNITSKSDVGTYVYGENGAGPHAVTSISGVKSNVYTYDQRGNRVSAVGEIVEYTWFNVPKKITRSSVQVEFGYGPDNARSEQIVRGKSQGSSTFDIVRERKIYFGGRYEKIITSSSERDVHYIAGIDGNVAVYTTSSNSADRVRYLHPDHLGSVHAMSDEVGLVVERLSFDPWGLKRNADWTPATAPIMSQIDRTFTGHEYLDDLSLIHMGGRMYDPVVGRFMSADPIIQQPENTQSLNRYSYVLNNPVSYTDPSGYRFSKLFKKVLRIAVSVAIAYALGGPTAIQFLTGIVKSATIATAISGVAIGIATSTVGTVLGGGSIEDGFKAGLKNAPWSAASAFISMQIGDAFTGEGWAAKAFGEQSVREAKAVAHGLAQGSLAKARGQSFMPAFLSGGVGDYASGSSGEFKFVRSVLLGGTASALGGGKFEDGAMSAAFVHLFNSGLHELREYDPRDPQYHQYETENSICSTKMKWCTIESVYEVLLRYPAPGADGSKPVSTGDLTEITFLGISGGKVQHIVDPDTYTVHNVTLPGHIFHDGRVSRQVIESNGTISIRSTGVGVGSNRALNLGVANRGWSSVDDRIAEEVRRGAR